MRLPTVTRRALPALVGTVACALAAGACRPPDVTSRVLGGDPPAARGTAAAAAPARFVHPGVLVSRPQLRFVRAQVRAGRQPWDAAFAAMMASRYADLARRPRARRVVTCGPYSRPNLGCTDEREAALAAYTHALAWFITRDRRHARAAIRLMNAWSRVIRAHRGPNAPLQTAWAGSVWPRAAEIVAATHRWPRARRFRRMLRRVYLPQVIRGAPGRNGNWELTMMDASIGIAVHLERRRAYRRAVRRFLRRVPAYLYLESDGALPRTAGAGAPRGRDAVLDYWHGPATLQTGLAQETCRDFTHAGYGLAAIAHVAETARIQGRDLYPRVAERLRHALGFHARHELGMATTGNPCRTALDLGLGPVTEVGFNALHRRLGHAMAATQRLTEERRPAGTNDLFVAWETLTHAENPR